MKENNKMYQIIDTIGFGDEHESCDPIEQLERLMQGL